MTDFLQIPLFPLGLVVFPGENLNLHIFEPRYRQLVKEVNLSGQTFGIPPFKESSQIQFGTEMTLEAISHTYPDGKMDIKTKGHRVFKVESFENKMDGKLYPGGQIEYLINDYNNIDTSSITGYTEVDTLIEKLYLLLEVDQKPPVINSGQSIYNLAHKIGLNFSQELELLLIGEEQSRVNYILEHLKHFLPKAEAMQTLKSRVAMNGHFKNIIPPKI